MTAMLDLTNHHVIAGTGSRSLAIMPYEHVNRIFNQVADHLVEAKRRHEKVMVLSGGAEGFDHVMATAAMATETPYVLILPNKGYLAYYWREHSVTGQDQSEDACAMKNGALWIEYVMEDVHHSSSLRLNGVHANFIRNERMVELADEFLVYNPTSPGTAHCVTKILAAKKPFTILFEGS